MDNHGEGDFVQLSDDDVKCRVDVCETIFCLFLEIPNSHLTSIIKLKPRTKNNSACV